MNLQDAWLEFSRDHRGLQQFGQKDDVSTFNGATGCTHTVLQRLILAKTGKLYTHDEISHIAGYPWPANNPRRRGLYSGGGQDEVGKVIDRFNLPYKLIPDAPYKQWRPWLPGAHKHRGPVIIGILYGWWPEKRGYRYGSTVSDGKPNGYSTHGGKTQLYGAEWIYHATLVIGAKKNPDRKNQFFAYANEPNHGSPSRPEKPTFDRITTVQLRRAYEKYGYRGRPLLAWVPTEEFRPRGY